MCREHTREQGENRRPLTYQTVCREYTREQGENRRPLTNQTVCREHTREQGENNVMLKALKIIVYRRWS